MRRNPLPFDDLKARGTAIVIVRKTLAEIAADVCRRRGDVEAWEIFGRGRSKRIVDARDEVIGIAWGLNYTLHMIGKRFPRPENVEGCMDHSSVHGAKERYAEVMRLAKMAQVQRTNEENALAYRDYLRGVGSRAQEQAA